MTVCQDELSTGVARLVPRTSVSSSVEDARAVLRRGVIHSRVTLSTNY